MSGTDDTGGGTDTGTDTGTGTDTDGLSIMRGTPMVVAKSSWYTAATNFALDVENWKSFKNDYHLNTIRVCWIGPHIRDHEDSQPVWSPTDEEFLQTWDTLVANAKEAGMNIIINYHNVGEQDKGNDPGSDLSYGFEEVSAFWDAIAPRYKNKPNVYYELSNEPSFQGIDYLDPVFKANLLGVYDKVRAAAPEREILMFSFSSADFDIPGIVAAYENDIDWDHTTIAFHAYFQDSASDQTTDAFQAVIDTGHRAVCTESEYQERREDFTWVKTINGSPFPASALEAMGIGWMDWRDWDQYDTLGEATVWLKKLMIDAVDNDYAWFNYDPTGDTDSETAVLVPSLLTNGDFEDGTTGWYSDSAQIANTTTAHLGTSAVEVTARTAEWGAARQDVTAKALQNGHAKSYNVSAWVRLADGADPATARISVYVEDSGDVQYAGEYINSAQLALTEEYQQLTGSYFVDWPESEDLTAVHFYVDTTAGTSSIIVDDCEMILAQ
jgi:hypothetical protein